jgi:hypothetical protein
MEREKRKLREIIRYNLEFEKTIEYFNWTLDGGNTLSKELEKVLDFEKGQFFTLLPEDADFGALYEFADGWILPQNPTYVQFDASGNKSGSYTIVPQLNHEISDFIFNKMEFKNNRVCVFEDVLTRPEHPHLEFFHQYGLQYLNECYYFLSRDNDSPEIIAQTISESGAIWHTLFILTESDNLKALGKEITLESIREFCKNVQLLVLGAYDGEGYVFWEPGKAM